MTKIIEVENRLVVARGERGESEREECGYKRAEKGMLVMLRCQYPGCDIALWFFEALLFRETG